MWNERIQVGIEKPEKEPTSIDEMRKAITVASQHSSIVRNAMMSADYQGLSGEDRYAMLAYYALRQLESTHRHLMAYVNITPGPIVIDRAADSANGGEKRE